MILSVLYITEDTLDWISFYIRIEYYLKPSQICHSFVFDSPDQQSQKDQQSQQDRYPHTEVFKMPSCASVFSLILGVTTIITAGVSIATPYWIQNKSGSPEFNAGLWQKCDADSCQALNQSQSIPVWFSASRIVMSVAAANAVVSLLVLMGYLCCGCCMYSLKAIQFNIIVCLVGCLESAASVIIYSVEYADTDFRTYLGYSGTTTLTWGFYLAAVTSASFLLTILFSVCETTNARIRRDYEPIRPTNVS